MSKPKQSAFLELESPWVKSHKCGILPVRMDWRDDINKRAIAILRVSSARQKDNHSHEVQEKEISSYCEEHGLKLIEVRRIVESAKNAHNRKQFNDAIAWALENGCLHAVFHTFDRESRNLSDNEKNERLIRSPSVSGKMSHELENDRGR